MAFFFNCFGTFLFLSLSSVGICYNRPYDMTCIHRFIISFLYFQLLSPVRSLFSAYIMSDSTNTPAAAVLLVFILFPAFISPACFRGSKYHEGQEHGMMSSPSTPLYSAAQSVWSTFPCPHCALVPSPISCFSFGLCTMSHSHLLPFSMSLFTPLFPE